MNKSTRTQVVMELMGQASEYKALGKTAEALAIYERILRRTDFSDDGVISELVMLYDEEKRNELYKKAALYALSRFDKEAFSKYCKLLGEELSFSVTSIKGENIDVTLEDEKVTVDLEDDLSESPDEEELEQKEDSLMDDIIEEVPQINDIETKEPPTRVEKNASSKKKRILPTMNDIADVLQSGGVEQALYMLEKLEAEEGEVKDLWYLKALCYVSNNDMKSAKFAIDTELGLYPDNDKAKRLAADIGRVVGKKDK